MIAAATGNEQIPAIDEQPPTIGPNLAANPALCVAVTKYITENYWWPYFLIQQSQWQACRQIDNAWRVRYAASDLNFTAVTRQTLAQSQPLAQDGKSAIGQSVMPFKQIKAITDLGEILSFENGLPMRAMVPEDIEEDLFYQPTQSSADALNSILRINADEVEFRDNYRRAFGCFAKYGYGWVHAPFELIRYEQPTPLPMQGPMDPMALQAMHPNERIEMTPQGPMLMEGRIAVRTGFIPLHVEDVYADPFLPCSPMDKQPCPLVRSFGSPETLRNHVYDPQANPFGFLNVEQAIQQQKGHFMLTDQESDLLRQRLQNRYNLNDQIVTGKQRSRAHSLWTAYAMLAIGPDGRLDEGEGVSCATCAGVGKAETDVPNEIGELIPQVVPCPHCQGTGKMHYLPKRYVVQMFGGITLETTCLRIQEMPVDSAGKPMDVPILFSADLVEDDSASIPMGLSQVMLLACEQATRAECQFEAAKEYTINRPWKVKWDSPAWKLQNLNTPNGKIPIESDPKEAERAEASSYDETATLMTYIEYRNNQIQSIGGASETLLGQISSGRRSALEVGEATEAAKNPLVIKVDRFNHQICGKWAKLVQRNLELFGDRDYIRRITGRTYFGKCRIFTAVGQEFVKRLAVAQAIRETLQVSAADPVLMPVRADLWNQYFRAIGINVQVPDDGARKARIDALNIIAKILSQGIPDPALPSDPHQIFCAAFESALKDEYWVQKYPENLPLLYQRLLVQSQMLQQQQMAEMQQQIALNAAMNPQKGPPNADKGREPAADRGSQNQQAQG